MVLVSLYKDIFRNTKWYLTAGQVREMKDGETTRFLCLDRNFWDVIPSSDLNIYSPYDLFRNNYIVEFTKVGGRDSIRGTFTWMYDDFKIADGEIDDRPFDFSIFGNYWKPWIRQERRDNPNDPRYWIIEDVGYHVVQDHYFLGWRGPMIRWDTITNQCPLIVNDGPHT